MRGCMVVIGVFLAVFVLLPLYTMMSKSVENKDGDFIGLANYAEYFSTPALFLSAINSLYISVIGTVLVLGTAFVYGYALTRTCMPFKWFFQADRGDPAADALALERHLAGLLVRQARASPRTCCSANRSTGPSASSSAPATGSFPMR